MFLYRLIHLNSAQIKYMANIKSVFIFSDNILIIRFGFIIVTILKLII